MYTALFFSDRSSELFINLLSRVVLLTSTPTIVDFSSRVSDIKKKIMMHFLRINGERFKIVYPWISSVELEIDIQVWNSSIYV